MRSRSVFAVLLILCVFLFMGCKDFVSTSAPFDDTTDSSAEDTTDVSSDTSDTVGNALPEDSNVSEPPESAEDSTEETSVPEEIDGETVQPAARITVPSPIGKHIEEIGEIPFPEEQILIVNSYYALPVGTVFEVTFVGEREGDELHIAPESLLVLHVSNGIELKNAVVSSENKTVYLTFDDGPHKTNTLRVLDILDEYGVKATFFLVGENIEKNPELVREIHARGHKIGCHSFTHVYAEIYASVENMETEIAHWEAAVESALGFVPEERLFRFPGGSTTCKEEGIRQMLAEQGFRAYDWNAVNNDCMLHTRPEDMTDEEYIKDSVISTLAYSFRMKTSPHIMLMHDTYVQTADTLPWMIEYMLEQGCTFGTLDELASGWLHGG